MSPLLRVLTHRFLAVPPGVSAVDGKEFLLRTARLLAGRADLEALSLWSPSYFLSLMDFMTEHRREIGFSGDFRDLWPELKFISAWDSAQARAPAERLKRAFPGVRFQAKGLLATEGPMTVPWTRAGGAVPLPHLTYYEFLDPAGNLRLLTQLREGERYELIPSFPNGLLRYRIGDHVRVTGFYMRGGPRLEFLGRSGESSDLVGEKLSGELARRLFEDLPLDFFVLYPVSGDGYQLLWDGSVPISTEEFEKRLQSAHHYRLARELGQLRPLRSRRVTDLLSLFRRVRREMGILEGDIKEQNVFPDDRIGVRIQNLFGHFPEGLR